tara:strand:- start:3147 stop:3299 length:153 start_codon:yes stop_codon:yes gene_type:complete
MEELNKNKVYYRRNKDKWKRGGKYYNYVPKDKRQTEKFKVQRGSFLISFD